MRRRVRGALPMHVTARRAASTGRLLAVLGLLACLMALVYTGTAAASQPKALINDATVSGGMSSEEAQFATAAGFAVTVVSDATWATMSAADFGQYDLLIAGDPNCGTLPPGLVASAPVWGSVVLGHAGGRTKAGNRTIVGTDPVLHSGGDTSSPRAVVIKDGIVYAGQQPGRTGMYLDTTCAANYYGQSAETLAVVNAISEGSGAWTLDAGPPCGGNVSLIASNPTFSDLTTADLEGWGCSVHESFPTFTSDWSALAVATDTASHPTCGVDPNTGDSACGEAYVLISGSSIVVKSGSISVTPTDATNPTGTDHTVTAHVTSGGSPLAGQAVDFTVTGQNAGATGTCVPAGCVTDSNGDVSFTYHDSNGAGDDTIKASFVDEAGSLQSATAQKHWVGAIEQPISAGGVAVSATEGSSFTGTTATITDPDPTSTAAEYSAMIDWGDGSTSTGTVSGPTGGPFDVSGTHTYADEGSYTVTTTINDSDEPSNGAVATSTATVADAALSAGALSVSGATEGGSPTNASFGFSDANAGATAADFTASISWGDGSTTAGTVSASGTGWVVNGSHTYADEGSYPVSVTVTDDGGSTTGATGTAKVADAALSASGLPLIISPQAYAGPVATFTDANAGSTAADFTATINWGDGGSSTGTVAGGAGSYTVSGSHTYSSTGSFTIKVHIVDDGGSTADAQTPILVFGAVAGGNFVIGNRNAAIGTNVTFWGAQWWKLNSLSGGAGPAAFKGFEDSPAVATCNVSWTTDPGNSTPPPAGPLPAYMAVIVSSKITKSGSTISGDTQHIVVVKTNPGYASDPGHAGTGTVVATVC